MTLNSVNELILRPFIKDNLTGIKSMKLINHYSDKFKFNYISHH